MAVFNLEVLSRIKDHYGRNRRNKGLFEPSFMIGSFCAEEARYKINAISFFLQVILVVWFPNVTNRKEVTIRTTQEDGLLLSFYL